MSTDLETVNKRIFYFNINYACNNRCIFCYSHNTLLSNYHDECSTNKIITYLEQFEVNEKDRIIINGGEPLLYSNFENLIAELKRYNCEILIYTNGRLLDKVPHDCFSQNIRVIVPIHGCEMVHDKITRIPGSFKETMNGIKSVDENCQCFLDIKIIINPEMIYNTTVLEECLRAYDAVSFNGAVHIVKMADTKVSIRNGCASIDNNQAAMYTRILFDYWKSRGKIVKIFDTCIKELEIEDKLIVQNDLNVKVFFKDCHLEKEIPLERSFPGECFDCQIKNICQSAVEQYRVLEYRQNNYIINLE